MAYPYQPLDSTTQQFRLLEILPAQTSGREALVCRLRIVSHEDEPRPKYEAISYYWGDPKPTHQLIVDDHVVLVPESTALALRRMALPYCSRVVWIDAICINQADLSERSTQVSMMGSIYSRSSGTLVYLGEEDVLTARAFQNVRQITVEVEHDTEGVGSLWDLLRRSFAETGWATASSPARTSLDTEALCALFDRPWFRRVWVIQEVSLAPSSRCHCGTSELDMLDLFSAAVWLRQWHGVHLPRELFRCAGLLMAATKWQLCLPSMKTLLTLASCLAIAHDLETSDERDRVYGMLGMVFDNIDKPSQHLLRIDYTRPTSHVFRDAMRFCIEYEGTIVLLMQINHLSDDDLGSDNWPSWVPHLERSHVSGRDPGVLDFGYNKRPQRSKTITSGCHDAAYTSASPVDPSLDILELVGVQCQSIEKLSVNELRHNGTFGELRNWLRHCAEIVNPIDANVAILSRTLSAGVTYSKQRTTDQDRTGLEDLLHYSKDEPGELAQFQMIDPFSNTLRMRASRYYDALTRVSRFRKLAIMRTGDLALVPKICREGDIIAIMHNCEKPLALRPVGEYYLLLGECYLDGYMWEDERVKLDEENREEIVFRIR